MMCDGLDDSTGEGNNWRMVPVVAFEGTPNGFGASLQRRAHVLSTAALGPFGVPLNLAVASPDGHWIAAVGDQQKVILINQTDGYSSRLLPFAPARFDYDFLDPGAEVGAQYCAWNASSTLLAVTSDSLHALFVFSIPSGQLAMRVEGYVRTLMPVTFAPWNDRAVIFAEESKMVHVRVVPNTNAPSSTPTVPGVVDFNAREDLAEPGPSSQLLRVRENPNKGGAGRRRVTGMAATPDGDLLVATKQNVLYRYLPSKPWTPEETKSWPEEFKKAVETVLLCASVKNSPLAALPTPVVLQIIKYVAGKRSDWIRVEAEPGFTPLAHPEAPPAAVPPVE
jgi:hypothetical protein